MSLHRRPSQSSLLANESFFFYFLRKHFFSKYRFFSKNSTIAQSIFTTFRLHLLLMLCQSVASVCQTNLNLSILVRVTVTGEIVPNTFTELSIVKENLRFLFYYCRNSMHNLLHIFMHFLFLSLSPILSLPLSLYLFLPPSRALWAALADNIPLSHRPLQTLSHSDSMKLFMVQLGTQGFADKVHFLRNKKFRPFHLPSSQPAIHQPLHTHTHAHAPRHTLFFSLFIFEHLAKLDCMLLEIQRVRE